MRRSEKNKKIKIKIKTDPEPKLCKIIKLSTSIIFCQMYVDQDGDEFWSKTSITMIIILMDFYLSFYVSNNSVIHLVVFHQLFLSFYLFFLIFENQCAAGNVIQLNKKKISLRK